MDSRIPGPPYPFERLGGKYPPHEVADKVDVVKRLVLAQVFDDTVGEGEVSVSLWMSVPDARLRAVLALAFEPDSAGTVGDLSNPTIHLMATEDFERDPVPVEDLIGTAAAPGQLIQAGLRGFLYSPTEEVEGIRADLVLSGPLVDGANKGLGKWVAKGRWQALQPMSEIEWRDAVAKMVLTATPAPPLRLQPYNPG